MEKSSLFADDIALYIKPETVMIFFVNWLCLVLAAQSAQGSGMSMIIMMVAIFAIMWFFMIKPQQKKQKEIQKFQNELTEGQQVITGGGIYGTVKSIDLTKNTVDIKIARDVVITVDKSYVFKDTANVPMQK